MSAKKTDAEKELQQKVKVLLKLFASGCKTEKQIMSIQMEDALKIQGITIDDLRAIMEIQKQVKAHTLFSYLGGGMDEHPNND